MRITKTAEERRNELIKTAEHLFVKYGYENTSVSQIVKHINVAQGTFYYYFKTKEEILDAIIDRYITQTIQAMHRIANETGPNAVDKLIAIFQFFSTFREDHKSLMQYLHEEKNAHLHLKFERKLPPKTIDPLAHIIKQGKKEELFNTEYPKEAAKAFIGLSAMVLQGIYTIEPASDEYVQKYHAVFDFLERILGAQTGSLFHIYNQKGRINQYNNIKGG